MVRAWGHPRHNLDTTSTQPRHMPRQPRHLDSQGSGHDALHSIHSASERVCFSEKSSTDAAKTFADAVPFRVMASDPKRGIPPGSLHSRRLVRRAPSKPLRRYARLRFLRESCSPGSPCVKHWWKGAARLQIRALHAIGTASESPASHAFKPAPYSLPVDVLTVWSAPVNRVQSDAFVDQCFR